MKALPDAEQIYEAINGPVLHRVPATATHVLDVGCGSGALGRQLKNTRRCHVTGVTSSMVESACAAQYLDQVLFLDLNHPEWGQIGEFDCIICSHVLEHLYHPEQLLKGLRRHLIQSGTLIVAIPNVLHWRQRLEFLLGRFRYSDGGLLDRTHCRFFDWTTSQAILSDSGYLVVEKSSVGGLPLSRLMLRFQSWIDRGATRLLPGFFGFQFVFVCRPS